MRKSRNRLLTLFAAAMVVVPLTTLSLGAAVAPIANADQTTDYLFNSSTGYTGNASDPDVEPCWYNNQSGYCMYTSQDLGQSGSGCNGGFPMNQTLGFWSPDGSSWTYEG